MSAANSRYVDWQEGSRRGARSHVPEGGWLGHDALAVGSLMRVADALERLVPLLESLTPAGREEAREKAAREEDYEVRLRWHHLAKRASHSLRRRLRASRAWPANLSAPVRQAADRLVRETLLPADLRGGGVVAAPTDADAARAVRWAAEVGFADLVPHATPKLRAWLLEPPS